MSRAFIKEDAAADDVLVTPRPPLPPGVENLVTPTGLAALEEELRELRAEEARLSAQQGAGSDTGLVRRLAALDEEILILEDRIASAVLVPTPPAGTAEVKLGATVTTKEVGAGASSVTFTIVGVDEADPLEGLVAFTAPVAQALLGRRAGEVVSFESGSGRQDVELLEVAYELASA